MTIKEMEALTRMSRANIRYYEAQGLICPAREGNGYRNYSEEDARALAKIRLLRMDEGEPLAWERNSEVTFRDGKGRRYIGCILAELAVLAAIAVGTILTGG